MLTQKLSREDPPHIYLSMICFARCRCGLVSNLRLLGKSCIILYCIFARSRWSFIQAVSREMAVFSLSCFLVVCEGSSMGCVSALLTNAVRL